MFKAPFSFDGRIVGIELFPVWYYRWYRFWCCLFSRFSYFVSWCGCRFRRWFPVWYLDWYRSGNSFHMVLFGAGREAVA